MKFYILILTFLGVASARKFHDHKVYKVYVETKEQVRLLHMIDADSTTKMTLFGEPHGIPSEAYVMIPPDELKDGLFMLGAARLRHELVHDDLQSVFDENKRLNEEAKKNSDPFAHTFWRTEEEIRQWIDNRVANCPSGMTCEVENIGETYFQGQNYVLKLSTAGTNKPIFWWDSTIHAREWIAPATGLYVIDQLVDGFARNDADVIRYFNRWDFIFLPLVNADGYYYTHHEDGDRTWRKTMQGFENPENFCFGADCNRNFGFHWGEVGNSPDVCSDIYGGEDEWSEPEARNQRDYMTGLQRAGRTIDFMLTVHSHGEYILMPYGYTLEDARNYDDLLRVANAGHDAILATSGRSWRVGPSSIVLYPSSGTSRDWGHGAGPPGDDEGEIGAGIEFVYTLELRGDGFSFYPPPRLILPSGREIWAMMEAMMDEFLSFK